MSERLFYLVLVFPFLQAWFLEAGVGWTAAGIVGVVFPFFSFLLIAIRPGLVEQHTQIFRSASALFIVTPVVLAAIVNIYNRCTTSYTQLTLAATIALAAGGGTAFTLAMKRECDRARLRRYATAALFALLLGNAGVGYFYHSNVLGLRCGGFDPTPY